MVEKSKQLPPRASIVIIGGGVIGCSIAYHLSHTESDVVLIERAELTSGSTWHAAGLVGQLRSSLNVTTMLTHSVSLYSRLEQETGQPTGWRAVGGLRIASSADRMVELKKAATMAKSFGLPMELLTPSEAHKLFPLMSLEGVVGAAFLPTDGFADPTMLTQALAKGARDRGVRIFRNIRVLSLEVRDRSVTTIVTSQGNISADTIVNAAGMWSREIGKMAGVNIPIVPVQHQYLVTETIADMPRNMPTMRDPDNLVYYKEEVGGLVMGGYEPNPIAWSVDAIAQDFTQQLLAPNFEHFSQLAELAIKRTPILKTVGVKKLFNGPEAFTPDGYFIMGRAPELKNFYVACGFNAHGIAAAGGVGHMMAEWILDGRPSLDLWAVDIRRFGSHYRELSHVKARSLELYGKHYSIAWPHEEHESARNIFKSPLYPILERKRAVFGSKFGWERPNWFAPPGSKGCDKYTFGWPNWHGAVGNEHKNIREKVALIDQSSFSKFEIHGKDALAFLQNVAVNNVNRPVGALIYTQCCNPSGGIEADLTIQRLGESSFYVVTGTAFRIHDYYWLLDNIPKGSDISIRDVTEEKTVINLCGPLSRKVLENVTSADVSNSGFPFAQCRVLEISGHKLIAARVTYVGELGWELHIPTESAASVYQALSDAGQNLGIIDAGYRAIESCRLEKGYRYWSAELGPDFNPYEAGLGFCVDLTKSDFIGKTALQKIKIDGVKKRLCCFTLQKVVPLHGKETVYHNETMVGLVTSGGYGYTVEKSIAYGYVPVEHIDESNYSIEVLGEKIAAIRHNEILYDPKRLKILG